MQFPTTRGRRRAIAAAVAATTALGFLILGQQAANAATTPSVSGSVGPLETDFTSAVTIPKFDPANGKLTSITCTLSGTVSGEDGYENLSTLGVAPSIDLHLEAQITLQRPDQTQLSSVVSVANTTDTNVPTYDGKRDFGGTSGKTYTGLTNTKSASFTLNSAADLALFTGPGNVSLPVVGVGMSSADANGNVATFFFTEGAARVDCGYNYLPQADIGVAKAGPANLVRGTIGTYNLTVTNGGPKDTEGTTTVTDVLPAGLTFVADGSGGNGFTCSASGQTVTCTNPSVIANGASLVVPIRVQVAQNAPNSVTNSATIGNPGIVDPNPGNDTSGPITTPITTVADLALTKTLSSSLLPSTGVATYSLAVKNNGPSDTTGTTTVTDTLPAGLTFLDGSGGGFTCSNAGQTVTCTTTDVLANGSTKTISLRVNVTAAEGTSITNSATVSNPGANDPTPGNNTGTSTDTVGPVPNSDLAIVKTGPSTITAGNDVTYTMKVTNNGAFDTPSATVTDTLPAGLTFVSGSGGGFTCTAAGQLVTCTAPAGFASGTNGTIIMVVSTSPGLTGPITNTAVVSGPYPDQVPGNNSSTTTGATVTQSADLTIKKTTSGLTAGSAGSYNLAVTNNGPSNAPASTTVTDTLPAGLTFVSGSGDGFACTNSGQAVTCTLNAGLAASATKNITLNVQVAPNATSPIVNTAVVSNPADSNPANNSSTVSTPLGASDDFTILKTASGTFVPGTAKNTYVLKVTNNGPSNSAGTTVVTDTLPTGLTFFSASGGGFTCTHSGQDVTCTNPDPIANGASASINLVVSIGAGVIGPVSNTAVVTNPNDGNPANNSSTVSTPLSPSNDLSLVKKTSGTFTAGVNGTYTLDVKNNGPSDSAGLTTIVDTLPAGLTFVSASGGGFTCSNSGQDVSCMSSASIPNGATRTVTLVVAVVSTQVTSVTNSATVSNPNDGNPANDTSSVSVTPGVSDDLTIVKSTRGLTAGAAGSYRLAVTNLGPSVTAGTTTVSDTLPAGLTFVSASGGGFTCTNAGQAVSCTSSASIAVNSPQTITVNVTVAAGLTGTVLNTATVANPNDGNPENNSSSTATPLTILSDFSIIKSVDGAFVPGTNAKYSLAVTNNGPSNSSGTTVVTDPLPAGLTFVSGSGAGFNCSALGQNVTCSRASSIPKGEVDTITLTIAVASNVTGPVSNTATVTNPNDGNPDNNSSTVSTSPTGGNGTGGNGNGGNGTNGNGPGGNSDGSPGGGETASTGVNALPSTLLLALLLLLGGAGLLMTVRRRPAPTAASAFAVVTRTTGHVINPVPFAGRHRAAVGFVVSVGVRARAVRGPRRT